MKQFLRYTLNRYLWFWLYYRQWFQNPDGNKHFGEQYLGHTLDETLKKSKKLKKQNESLADKKQRLIKKKNESEADVTLQYSERRIAKRKLRKNGFYITLFLLGESYLNFIILELFTGRPVSPIDALLKYLLAFLITGIVIIIAEVFISQLLLLFGDKSKRTKYTIPLFILFLILMVTVEYMTYQFAMVRAYDFEGGFTVKSAGIALALLSMILPLAAGYLAFEIMQTIGPYYNTLRIESLDKKIGKIERQIKANEEEEDKYFLLSCNNRYSVIDEWKVYKNNYDAKTKDGKENITNHFVETREKFYDKAKEEYLRKVKDKLTVLTPERLLPTSQNGTYQNTSKPLNT